MPATSSDPIQSTLNTHFAINIQSTPYPVTNIFSVPTCKITELEFGYLATWAYSADINHGGLIRKTAMKMKKRGKTNKRQWGVVVEVVGWGKTNNGRRLREATPCVVVSSSRPRFDELPIHSPFSFACVQVLRPPGLIVFFFSKKKKKKSLFILFSSFFPIRSCPVVLSEDCRLQ